MQTDVSLRPFLPGDEDIIYEWQSAPGIRDYSRNPAVPAREEHAAWFAAAMRDRGARTFIILFGPDRAGMIRLTMPKGDAAAGRLEVSLLVAPEHHGKGVAGKALRLVLRDHAVTAGILAEVHPENAVSRKLFLSCGFVPLAGNWYVYEPVCN